MIIHINDLATRIAARTDPDMKCFTHLHWCDNVNQSEALEYLRNLHDPSVCVRRMSLGDRHSGFCAVVVAPVLYPRLQQIVPTVMIHTDIFSDRASADAAAKKLSKYI